MGKTRHLPLLLRYSSQPALSLDNQSGSLDSGHLCRHPVRREIFLEEFWKCFNRLEDTADEMVGKAAYFRFLTLLGEAPVLLS